MAEERAVLAKVAALAAAANGLATDVPAAPRRESAWSAYTQLLAFLDDADLGEREILEHGLSDVLTGTSPSVLNHHLLGSVLLRAIAANPSYWLVDGPVAPRPELLAKLDRALDAVGREASPYGAIGEGIHAFVRGDDESAYERFSKARTHPLFASIVRDDFIGARTCRRLPALSEIRELAFPLPVGELRWVQRAPLGAEPYVISYCCDDSYFRAFASRILASLPHDARGLTLHFHIVAPMPETHELIEALVDEARLRRLSLHVSTEATPTRDRAYFASARFVRMAELLQSFDRPLLFLDTDTEFESDPREWCKGFGPEAVNILFCKGPWSGGFVPWRAFWAGMVYVPQNRLGRRFADVVHRVLAYLWTPEPHQNWFVDQNALYVTYVLVREERGARGFEDLPPERYGQLRHTRELKQRRLAQVEAV